MNGAKVVARAWTDPAYRRRLLATGTAAIDELGFGGPQGEHVVVVENTPAVHNVVVCTLCSCYPWPVLGLPPSWYKDPAYRSRVVREPRAVLAEMGPRARPAHRDPRLGQQRGGPLPGPPERRGHGRPRRGRARRARHPRRDDRRGAGEGAVTSSASSTCRARPRRRGGTASSCSPSPWESRIFGVTLALLDAGRFTWDEFRARLIGALARSPTARGTTTPGPSH
jgi:hypothetical protein